MTWVRVASVEVGRKTGCLWRLKAEFRGSGSGGEVADVTTYLALTTEREEQTDAIARVSGRVGQEVGKSGFSCELGWKALSGADVKMSSGWVSAGFCSGRVQGRTTIGQRQRAGLVA